MNKDIILIQTICGKYDVFILDMPLSLLYVSRFLVKEGYRVHILDQRVEKDNYYSNLKELLSREPLWVGITAMTGEPVRHGVDTANFIRQHSSSPIVWGGIHPTILPDQTIASDSVDYIIRGKGEIAVLKLSEMLNKQCEAKDVPGLTYKNEDGMIISNEEDEGYHWEEIPDVPYHLIDGKSYFRVGFDSKVFSIMTSRNCPHKCTFCYNSSIKKKLKWMPDGMAYTKKHIDYIIENYQPDYLSFIDDDFFVDRKRAREILEHIEQKKLKMKVGFRGARISDLDKLDDSMFDLMERVNTVHINIGVESGSELILKRIRKGITLEQIDRVNKRFFERPSFVPLYNFFSGIPGETQEDIRKSTDLILKLVKENPYCQISGFHQFTPYPGSELYNEAIENGFDEPQTLEEWGERRLEDNAKNCPWIDKRRKRLLDTIYCMIYFVDNKYDMYIASHKPYLKALIPFVFLYKKIAKMRMKHHITVFPIEIFGKNMIYRILTGKD